ncbi:hypothetical protein JB92DRAFT_3128009 [Gautieria morchelliformis]|nr:hypothetical protein JB92DRAFT_3128009 [Gautieria morchelliformis]
MPRTNDEGPTKPLDPLSVGWSRRSRPSNTHSRQSHLFHRASFPPLSRVEPILLIPTPTPLPPLPYSPSPASLAEQIAFINLRTSSRAVPAPQPAYPPSHPFSARGIVVSRASSSAIAKLPCDPAPPRSLLLKVPASREDSPDERDEEGSVSGYDTDTSTISLAAFPRLALFI